MPILREAVVRCPAPFFQLVPKLRDERFRLYCDASLLAIIAEPRMDVLPRQELRAVIPELVAFGNIQITRFEVVRDLNDNSDFEQPPVDRTGRRSDLQPCHERPPDIADEAEVQCWHLLGRGNRRHTRCPAVLIREYERNCIDQTTILRRGTERQMVQ